MLHDNLINRCLNCGHLTDYYLECPICHYKEFKQVPRSIKNQFFDKNIENDFRKKAANIAAKLTPTD
jgi:hypothetical protein